MNDWQQEVAWNQWNRRQNAHDGPYRAMRRWRRIAFSAIVLCLMMGLYLIATRW